MDPDHQGLAAGRRMAEALLEHFREQGVTRVRTLVDEEMEDLARFFDSLGFEPSSLRSFAKTL